MSEPKTTDLLAEQPPCATLFDAIRRACCELEGDRLVLNGVDGHPRETEWRRVGQAIARHLPGATYETQDVGLVLQHAGRCLDDFELWRLDWTGAQIRFTPVSYGARRAAGVAK